MLNMDEVPYATLLPKPPVTPERVTADRAGCWADGANWGWRLSRRAVEIAIAAGWPVSEDDRAWLDKFDHADANDCWDEQAGDASEAVTEMADDAVDWLTDNVAPLGYSFEFFDGDLMLWSDAASCAASGDVCQCTTPHDDEGNPI